MNGIPRPTGLIQPTRVAPPAPGAGEAAPAPMQGQPQDMQALLALLMMLLSQQGGAGLPPQGQPALPLPGVPGGP